MADAREPTPRIPETPGETPETSGTITVPAENPDGLVVMRADASGRPELVRRFVEEGQVTGQLAHPGIPPVHEMGTTPDGRRFLAMKLIRGRTLAELLAERAQSLSPRA